MRIRVCILLSLLFLSGVYNGASATTWAPKQVICPLCKTENTFMDIVSFGTYIYQWPEKFQFIFWPLTDTNVLYSCKKCRLTAFMWDFTALEKQNLAAIKTQLDGMKLEPGEESYNKTPMSQRLEIAEKVYSVLGKDETFWCQFYRVKGYHFEAEKKEADAATARRRALEICQKQLAANESSTVRKELMLISGAMKYFLKEDQQALKDLREAASLTYENSKLGEDKSKNFDGFLSALLKEYIARIESGIKPGNR